MTGNVCEFCADIDSIAAKKDSKFAAFRVYQGGNYFFKEPDCRIDEGSSVHPDFKGDGFGMRLALSVPTE